MNVRIEGEGEETVVLLPGFATAAPGHEKMQRQRLKISVFVYYKVNKDYDYATQYNYDIS